MTETAQSRKLLTFASGGWVLLGAGILTLAVFVWAVTPAVLMKINRPPGDGVTLASYEFDLTNLSVPPQLVTPIMLHREMPPRIDQPSYGSGVEMNEAIKEGTRSFLVSKDRVIGVEINGEARAYPVRMLNVHEIIQDTLGGVPIVVTYCWPTDSAVVFDRRVNGETLDFGVSGLLYNSNLLFFDRRGKEGIGTESLFSQLLGRAISGPLAGTELQIIPSQFIAWSDWYAHQPNATVVEPDYKFAKRYKKATPMEYFRSDGLLPSASVGPLPDDNTLRPKTRVVAVTANGERRIYTIEKLIKNANTNGTWSDRFGSVTLTFTPDIVSQTAGVMWAPVDAEVEITPCFWFAWYAMHHEEFQRNELVH